MRGASSSLIQIASQGDVELALPKRQEDAEQEQNALRDHRQDDGNDKGDEACFELGYN